MNANDQTTQHFDNLIAQADRNLKQCDQARNSDLWVQNFMVKLALINERTQGRRRSRGERVE
jgi:hypothetical protein